MGMKKIAIWGTGVIGKTTYQFMVDKREVFCFYDNDQDKWGGTLYGVPIKKWDKSDDCFIIVASKDYRMIIEQLKQYDVKICKNCIPYIYLFDSMIPYSDFCTVDECDAHEVLNFIGKDKKLLVLYGNCQTLMLGRIFSLHKRFRDNYIILSIPGICEYNSANRKYLESFLKDELVWDLIDVFVYQGVKENNRFHEKLATDFLLEKLKDDCQKIKIMNLYFDGYFVQAGKNENKIFSEICDEGLLLFADKYIDRLMNNGVAEKDILKLIESESFISSEEIENKVRESFNKFEEREKETDVPILDYIQNNYREYQLFYSANHPCNTLLIEYADRILGYIVLDEVENIDDTDVCLYAGSLKGQDIPLYPSVIANLGLKKYEKKYYFNRYLNEHYVYDFKSFCKRYIDLKGRGVH